MDPSSPPDSDLRAEPTDGSSADPAPDVPDADIAFGEDSQETFRLERLQRRLLFSTLFSGAVVLLSVGLALSMIDDLRYWLQDDAAPQEITLIDALEDPAGLTPYRDRYVALSATPDASTAVKLSLGREGKVTQKLRFFRLLEAGNRVFVQTDLPLGEAQDLPDMGVGVQTRKLPGRFVGRVHRLGELGFYSSLRDHFNAVARPEILKIPRAQWSTLGADNLGRRIEVESTKDAKARPITITLQQDDQFEVLLASPEWMLQLGTKSWPQEADAIERVKALGFPFVHLPYKPTALAGAHNPEAVVQGIQKQLFHRFLVRPGQGLSKTQLRDRLQQGIEIPENNAALEVGAAVLAQRRLYFAGLSGLRVEGETLRLTPTTRTSSPGYELRDGALVERTWSDEGLAVPLSEVLELRVRRPVNATEDSLIVLTDTPPSEQWPSALALGILGLLAVGNAWMGARFWRRYRQLRADDR